MNLIALFNSSKSATRNKHQQNMAFIFRCTDNERRKMGFEKNSPRAISTPGSSLSVRRTRTVDSRLPKGGVLHDPTTVADIPGACMARSELRRVSPTALHSSGNGDLGTGSPPPDPLISTTIKTGRHVRIRCLARGRFLIQMWHAFL